LIEEISALNVLTERLKNMRCDRRFQSHIVRGKKWVLSLLSLTRRDNERHEKCIFHDYRKTQFLFLINMYLIVVAAYKVTNEPRVPSGVTKIITYKMLRSLSWLGWPLQNICVTNDHSRYVLMVVVTMASFFLPSDVSMSNMTDATTGTGTTYNTGTPKFTHGFKCGSCCLTSRFCVGMWTIFLRK